MEKINERISTLIYNERVTNRALGIMLNTSENTISMKLNNKRKWSLEDVQLLASHYVKYSTEWLLLGKGPMYRTESTTNAIATGDNNIQVSGNGSSAVVNNELINVLQHQLEVKDKQIEMLMSKLG